MILGKRPISCFNSCQLREVHTVILVISRPSRVGADIQTFQIRRYPRLTLRVSMRYARQPGMVLDQNE